MLYLTTCNECNEINFFAVENCWTYARDELTHPITEYSFQNFILDETIQSKKLFFLSASVSCLCIETFF